MDVIAMLIDVETGGGIPLRCDIVKMTDYLQIKCNGDRGFIIEIPIEKLEILLADDLHG